MNSIQFSSNQNIIDFVSIYRFYYNVNVTLLSGLIKIKIILIKRNDGACKRAIE
jgi:hypothetical protein